MKIIGNDWDEHLGTLFDTEEYQNLRNFLDEEYSHKTIYPLKENIYNALRLTSYKDTKVVILGQDPYHEPNQAHGLAFSVNKGVDIPPSLVNIYKELNDDLGCPIAGHGNLTCWASQGVLLLNAVLTVERAKANSHKDKGWEKVTDKVIEELNKKEDPIVFILWGNNARRKKEFITNPIHLIIESAHPSPLSAYHGFFGSKPFSRTNNFLIKNNKRPVDWKVI
ncbi:MAG: uracil-DNA glycosylase [Erysipelotrichaceae bacterium]|nr:uracil-DNA glycosylase [Erysipelotrichaceae bacterium]